MLQKFELSKEHEIQAHLKFIENKDVSQSIQ